jgi:hypothetical protein
MGIPHELLNKTADNEVLQLNDDQKDSITGTREGLFKALWEKHLLSQEGGRGTHD